MPWRSLAGLSGEPGRICWLGHVTPRVARDLAAAAAADPACDWKVIITDEDGRAIAVTRIPRLRARFARGGGQGTGGPGGGGRGECGPGSGRKGECGQGGGGPGLFREVTLIVPRFLFTGGDTRTPALGRSGGLGGLGGAGRLGEVLSAALTAGAEAVADADARAAADAAAGGCAHTGASASYRVPPRMREYVQARDRTCRSPVCRQPASRCDQDHTLPHHQGGRTCPCNIGGTCRTHHQLKQLPGWRLEQPVPGHVHLGHPGWAVIHHQARPVSDLSYIGSCVVVDEYCRDSPAAEDNAGLSDDSEQMARIAEEYGCASPGCQMPPGRQIEHWSISSACG